MQSIINQFMQTIAHLQQNMGFVLTLVAILYVVYFLNLILGGRLMILGIYPRKIFGLIGIPFSPFIHGNFNHVFFNSIPFFIMVSFVLLEGLNTFVIVSGTIILLSGLGTWLIGRKGFHIGASSLIMGYWSYLLVNAYYHTTPVSIALAIVCLYYFGGLIFQIFPSEIKSSWEGHVSGFVAGIVAAYTTPYALAYLFPM